MLVLLLATAFTVGSLRGQQGGMGRAKPRESATPQEKRRAAGSAPSAKAVPPRVNYVDIAPEAGLNVLIIAGNDKRKKYIIETTGSGVALFDFDNDGWLDVFLVNGTRLEGVPEGQAPTNRLYRNNGKGAFTDVTEKAGLARGGWGQGVCAGDYDNDGNVDLFVTYWGHNVLYHNNGDGTFRDVTQQAGLFHQEERWGTGCAFLDYDRDGKLDLFVANYVDFDIKNTPVPGSTRHCQWKGLPVMCGPRGLKGSKSALYHNNGNGAFSDVSDQAGVSKPAGYYGLGVVTADFDNDGFTDVYVACDSTPSMLFHNNGDGTFTDIAVRAGAAYNEDGHEQAGMGVDTADFDGDGWLDLVKTNFADDTSTLYRNNGDGTFTDVTFPAGLGVNKQFLGWGVAFLDMDHDTWPDLFIANGHVYPEVDGQGLDSTFRQRKVVYWNQRNGTFRDISLAGGPAVQAPKSSRGLAVGDVDNDGSLEILVNNMEDRPQLLKNTGERKNWLLVKTVGTKSNRDGLGARVTVVTGTRRQFHDVRSGGTYASQGDFRAHFGLGDAAKADTLAVRWPSGLVETFQNVPANRLVVVKEGAGIVR